MGAGKAGGQQCIELMGNKRRPIAIALKLKPGAMALSKARERKVAVDLNHTSSGINSTESDPVGIGSDLSDTSRPQN